MKKTKKANVIEINRSCFKRTSAALALAISPQYLTPSPIESYE